MTSKFCKSNFSPLQKIPEIFDRLRNDYFLGLRAWLNVFLRANLLYFTYVISKKFLKLENISFSEAQIGPKWLFCEKNIVLRNANFWDLF